MLGLPRELCFPGSQISFEFVQLLAQFLNLLGFLVKGRLDLVNLRVRFRVKIEIKTDVRVRNRVKVWARVKARVRIRIRVRVSTSGCTREIISFVVANSME